MIYVIFVIFIKVNSVYWGNIIGTILLDIVFILVEYRQLLWTYSLYCGIYIVIILLLLVYHRDRRIVVNIVYSGKIKYLIEFWDFFLGYILS